MTTELCVQFGFQIIHKILDVVQFSLQISYFALGFRLGILQTFLRTKPNYTKLLLTLILYAYLRLCHILTNKHLSNQVRYLLILI